MKSYSKVSRKDHGISTFCRSATCLQSLVQRSSRLSYFHTSSGQYYQIVPSNLRLKFCSFIAQKAHEHGPELCIILPQLYQSGTISVGAIRASDRWQVLLDSPFHELSGANAEDERLTKSVYHCNALLDALEILAVPEDKTKSIWDELKELLGTSVTTDLIQSSRKANIFGTGKGFQHLVDKSLDDQTFALSLWPSLCEATLVG